MHGKSELINWCTEDLKQYYQELDDNYWKYTNRRRIEMDAEMRGIREVVYEREHSRNEKT